MQTYDDEVNMWFTKALGRPCTFVRCSNSKNRSCMNKVGREGLCRYTSSKLNFSNEGQLLLISEESLFDLNSRLNASMLLSFYYIISAKLYKKSLHYSDMKLDLLYLLPKHFSP